jgi:cyclophilin family peptidyl-prolyl cis-trans isomerase
MRQAFPALALALIAAPAGADDPGSKAPRVELLTTQGTIVLELDAARAPKSTVNFLRYVRDGHYDGTIFHRVITGFVAQGGGYDAEFAERETREPVQNESKNGLSNERGTIAMARTQDPHSATAQFYINLADNARLDGAEGRWGYTVFGRVVDGMDVVDAIAAVPTGPGGPFRSDVPQAPIVVREARVLDEG